jgi:single-strand DNA-binding protein
MLPRITMEAGVFADVELRFTPSGKAVAKIRTITKDRKQENGQWVDGDPCFLDVTVWGKAAENAAESITKGSTINVVGRLSMRTWEDKEGNKRTSYEVTADEIGVSIRWNPAISTTQEHPQGKPQEDDPWASPPAKTDEPPF